MDDRSTPAMMEGVQYCSNFILFLSGDRDFIDAAQNDHSLVAYEARYEVGAEIGQGSASKVVKARDLNGRRIVAVKTMTPPPNAAAFTQAQSTSLQRAAVLHGRIQHDNVLALFDFFMAAELKQFKMVMEFFDGLTMKQVLQRDGPRREAAAAEWIALALDGLSAVHKYCIHLDISLKNIMVSVSGEVKLIDFGLCRVDTHAAEDDPDLRSMMVTGGDEIDGQPEYMSPEAWRGHVDFRTDLWSIGVCLFQLVSGQLPFDTDPMYPRPRDIVAKVLYSTGRAPDIRQIIADTHAKDLAAGRASMSAWQVSDGFADVVAKSLDKDLGSRFSTALEMKQALADDVLRTATAYDIFIAYSSADERAARQLYTTLIEAAPISKSKENLTVYLAENFDESALKHLASSACFIPLISPAVLDSVASTTVEDPACNLMHIQCQLAQAMSAAGLITVLPLLYGSQRGQHMEELQRPHFSDQLSRITTKKLREFRALAVNCPRLRGVRLDADVQSISVTITSMLSSASAIKMWDEIEGMALDLPTAEKCCAEKLLSSVEQARKAKAGQVAARMHTALVEVDDDQDGSYLSQSASKAQASGEDSPPVRTNLHLSRAEVQRAKDSVRGEIDYTSLFVKANIKELAWFSKDVAIALKTPSGIERDLKRALALFWCSELALQQRATVRRAVELMFDGELDAASIVDGLDERDKALILDILDRATMPLSQIEVSNATAREPMPWEETFHALYRGFYSVALLAQEQATGSYLMSHLRKAVENEFVPMMRRQGYELGTQRLLAGCRDVEQLIGMADPNSEKIIRVQWELFLQVQSNGRRKEPSGNADLLTLVAFLAVMDPSEKRERLRQYAEHKILRPGVPGNRELANTVKMLWQGETDANVLRGGKDGNRLLRLIQDDKAKLAKAAAPFVLALEVIGDTMPDQANSSSKIAQHVIDKHKVDLRRIAQLAVAAVADSTGPAFCPGGVRLERQHAERNLLRSLESSGFKLLEPVRRLWAGERNIDVLAAGSDAKTRRVIEWVLDNVVESVEEVPEMQPDVQDVSALHAVRFSRPLGPLALPVHPMCEPHVAYECVPDRGAGAREDACGNAGRS
jgi:serine/threonine protein kinase